MRLGRAVRLSLRAMFSHRLRTTLALASVSVGTAAVTLTGSIGAGAEREVERSIARLGANLLVVRPAPVKRFVGRREFKGTVTTLKLDDQVAIARLPAVARAAPAVEGAAKVKAGASSMQTMVRGTTPAYVAIRRFQITRGRFFDDEDNGSARRVAVLGARVAETLFDENPVGQQIWIRSVPFDVIGVLAPKGALADGDQDNQIVVPLRTAMRRMFNIDWLSMVLVSARDAESTTETELAMAAVLRERHRTSGDGGGGGGGGGGEPDFEIQDATRFFTMQRKAGEILSRFSSTLAAVALLVGGMGIMGLMLVSVKERTSEIGLHMAVGARPRDVLTLFLLESSVLSLSGWAVGILGGAIGALVVKTSTAWPVAAGVQSILASLAMTVVIGLGFGAIPASKAASIPPVRALVAR